MVRIRSAARGTARWIVAIVIASALVACGRRAEKSPATVAAEKKAGDFADYWAEVVRLSRRHVAHPDSFRAALDSLPGTHLTDAEWEAWIAPYRAHPGKLASKLEETMAEVTPPPPAPNPARIPIPAPKTQGAAAPQPAAKSH